MGEREFGTKLYYQLSLDGLVPQDHLLRRIVLSSIRAGGLLGKSSDPKVCEKPASVQQQADPNNRYRAKDPRKLILSLASYGYEEVPDDIQS